MPPTGWATLGYATTSLDKEVAPASTIYWRDPLRIGYVSAAAFTYGFEPCNPYHIRRGADDRIRTDTALGLNQVTPTELVYVSMGRSIPTCRTTVVGVTRFAT